VAVTTQVATSGVQGIATIKNTGANGMNVRETGVDQFGVTSTVTTLVAAGNDLRLDPTNNVGTARPPYTRYSIEVQRESFPRNRPSEEAIGDGRVLVMLVQVSRR